ncbi:MAG: hypothetical protein PHP92_03615 [Candidatus Nanoarchaeia archaeon]|nr:hypothetical protein [Candidatus Nanoarchaeia archaeon]
MIKDYTQFQQSKQALRDIEKALSALRKKMLPQNRELFNAMAQDYIKDINNIKGEINEYIKHKA